MSFFDYFRNFLGVKPRDEPGTSGHRDYYSCGDNFRNPIWQNDEDDDDIDDFRHSRNGMHFNIFTDALEITRYFEAQMDSMLKNFGFGTFPFSENEGIGALPFATPKMEDNLRDGVLKSEPNPSISLEPNFPNRDIGRHRKVDTDLDGKITTEEFSKMWNNGNVRTVEPSVPSVHSFSFGRSVRKEIIRRPDGTIEQKQIISDNEGNQETIVSRGIGDKKHVITIKKDKNGAEIKSEDLINMDESELEDFNKKWRPSIRENTDDHKSNLNRFPWEKFFGPKL